MLNAGLVVSFSPSGGLPELDREWSNEGVELQVWSFSEFAVIFVLHHLFTRLEEDSMPAQCRICDRPGRQSQMGLARHFAMIIRHHFCHKLTTCCY